MLAAYHQIYGTVAKLGYVSAEIAWHRNTMAIVWQDARFEALSPYGRLIASRACVRAWGTKAPR